MKFNPQTFTQLDPRKLRKHPDSARQGDVDAIKTVIDAHGFGRPVTVWAKDNKTVLAGWHRSQAAAAAGLATIPCCIVDVDTKTARRIVLADNRTSDRGGYDDRLLAELLSEYSSSAADSVSAGSQNPTPETAGPQSYSYHLEQVGYTAEELERIIHAASGAPDQSDQLTPVHQITLDLTDPDAAGELKAELEAKKYKCSLKAVTK